MNGKYSQYLKNDHKCDKVKEILEQYFFQLSLKNYIWIKFWIKKFSVL